MCFLKYLSVVSIKNSYSDLQLVSSKLIYAYISMVIAFEALIVCLFFTN
jgi:hypothetical protein